MQLITCSALVIVDFMMSHVEKKLTFASLNLETGDIKGGS